VILLFSNARDPDGIVAAAPCSFRSESLRQQLNSEAVVVNTENVFAQQCSQLTPQNLTTYANDNALLSAAPAGLSISNQNLGFNQTFVSFAKTIDDSLNSPEPNGLCEVFSIPSSPAACSSTRPCQMISKTFASPSQRKFDFTLAAACEGCPQVTCSLATLRCQIINAIVFSGTSL
jgi:hypothetical protein